MPKALGGFLFGEFWVRPESADRLRGSHKKTVSLIVFQGEKFFPNLGGTGADPKGRRPPKGLVRVSYGSFQPLGGRDGGTSAK